MKLIKAFAELAMSRVVLMALLVSAGYYFASFDPGSAVEDQIKAVDAMVAQEEDRKREINLTMKKEEEMRGNVLQLQRNLDVVKAKIPFDLKDAEMQSVINAAANGSGVKITSLSSNNTPKDPAAPLVKINITDVKPENLIEEVKFKISLSGTFDDFINFLNSLAKENKVIKIRNFHIDKASDDVDEERINFSGDIVGFKQAKIEIISGAK